MSEKSGPTQSGLFVISGPSGSGKTTIVARVRETPGVFYSVSVTSRPPRRGEREGVDYHFVSRDEFERMVRDGELAEHAEVAGNLYGTPRCPLDEAIAKGRTAMVDIDVQGAMQIRKAFPAARLVFIRPPSMEDLEKRLRERGTESEESIQRRLKLARSEMEYVSKYDFVVVNDDLERAVEETKSIILGA